MKEGDLVFLQTPPPGKGPLYSDTGDGYAKSQLWRGRKFWRKILNEGRVWEIVKVTKIKPWSKPEQVKAVCVRPLDRTDDRLTKLPREFVRQLSALELLALQAE